VNRIRIAPIVEGHGEDQAIRTLIQRIWQEMLGGEYADVIKPIRGKRNTLVRREELTRAIHFALLKAGSPSTENAPLLVLVLLDADKEIPCVLGPALLALAKEIRADADIACVVANVEYETWFAAAAESLADYLLIAPGENIPQNPEQSRSGKGWVKQHFIGGERYSETVDQARMTARMDLTLCRRRSPSFDKLCRELERRRGQ